VRASLSLGGGGGLALNDLMVSGVSFFSFWWRWTWIVVGRTIGFSTVDGLVPCGDKSNVFLMAGRPSSHPCGGFFFCWCACLVLFFWKTAGCGLWLFWLIYLDGLPSVQPSSYLVGPRLFFVFLPVLVIVGGSTLGGLGWMVQWKKKVGSGGWSSLVAASGGNIPITIPALLCIPSDGRRLVLSTVD
jgi:hypothetical protein